MRTLPCILLLIACCHACAQTTHPASEDRRFLFGDVKYSDDFRNGLANWTTELESGGTVEAKNGKLEIDVAAGCSVWFKQEITGPVMIEYHATIIKAGGPNDRVSDLNCFWMATDSRSPNNILDVPRTGRFADYNQLRCYYVGLGGNANTTTRFRRYIGSPTTRPILPEHDLTEAKFLIDPNVKYHIQLIAAGGLIQYYRDGVKIFEFNDPEPYTRGWFAIRTTQNHMTVENFRVKAFSKRG